MNRDRRAHGVEYQRVKAHFMLYAGPLKREQQHATWFVFGYYPREMIDEEYIIVTGEFVYNIITSDK